MLRDPSARAATGPSQYKQWLKITKFYKWCRSKNIFLNVPDNYFMSGSNKTGMGYRETNWSLPRAQQHIHCRQNLYDGTWEKTPSMASGSTHVEGPFCAVPKITTGAGDHFSRPS